MQPHEASLRPDDGAAATSLAEDQLTDLLCMMMRPPAELWDGRAEEWDGLRGSFGPDRLACFDASGHDDGRGYTLASTSPVAGNGRTADGRTSEREGDDHQEAIRREESI